MLAAHRLQLVLISAVALISLYFSFQLSVQLFSCVPLAVQAPARVSQWEIEEVKGKFALKAFYSFEAQNKIWKGSCRFNPPYFWNEPSAMAALKAKAKEPVSAWYNPNNPSHSSLEKRFPSSLLFRTIICYGVLIYFFFVRRKFQNNLNIIRN